MSSLNLKEVFTAKEARAESFSNNPYDDELIEIMETIKENTQKGILTIDLPYLINPINTFRLIELGFVIQKSMKESITTINW